MLQQVDFITERGQELTLSPSDMSTGIILDSIDGLDPVKALLVSTTFATRDGTQHQHARREARDIIVRMSLDSRFGGGSVAQIRRMLYSLFPTKTKLKMVFHELGMPPVEISGIVEDAVSPRFTDEPTFAMSIHCNDPDFVNPVPHMDTGEGFPTSMNYKTVEYEGSEDSGLSIEVDVSGTGTGSGFIVQQITPTGSTRRLIFSADVRAQDTILIETHPGQKEVLLRRNSEDTSILWGIDPQSQWPMLQSGTNQIGFQVTGGTYQSYYEFRYHDRFGGI